MLGNNERKLWGYKGKKKDKDKEGTKTKRERSRIKRIKGEDKNWKVRKAKGERFGNKEANFGK